MSAWLRSTFVWRRGWPTPDTIEGLVQSGRIKTGVLSLHLTRPVADELRACKLCYNSTIPAESTITRGDARRLSRGKETF